MKNPKLRFDLGLFNFLVKFCTDRIKFHIVIVICEFCRKRRENSALYTV